MSVSSSSLSHRAFFLFLSLVSSLLLLVCAQQSKSPSDCRNAGLDCPDSGTCTYTTTNGGSKWECSYGLSTGAQAGISIGVIAVVTAIIVAVCFFARCGCFAYRRQQQFNQAQPPLMYAQQQPIPGQMGPSSTNYAAM